MGQSEKIESESVFQNGTLLAMLLPVLTSVLFAGSFVAGKFTTLELGALTTTLLRYTVTLVFLFCLKRPARIQRVNDGIGLAALGLFGIVGYHYFFFESLRHTAVVNTAIINATNPVITAIAAAVVLKERLQLRQYVGGVLSLTGVMLLLTRGDWMRLMQVGLNLGDGLMLCAVLSWVVYALWIKALVQRYSGFTVTFYSALAGVVLLIPLSLIEQMRSPIGALSVETLLSLLYMGVCASGIGYLLYNLSIQAIGPTRTASSVYSLVPVAVAILAYLFFKQPITGVEIGSAGLIIVGVWLALK